MSNATILVIEGKHADHPAFSADLRKKGYVVELTSSGSRALARLSDGFSPDVVIVNAASLRSSGRRMCQSIREKDINLPVLLILSEKNVLDEVEADVVLYLPFTAQKLSNRIQHLLPGDGKNTIHVGPIRLDKAHRTVRCLGKKSRLTPRLVMLLATLMEHHGELMERRALFSKVWETDYTEDTRTLDVHVSWLRQAIEVDPTHPRFLKTVRGMGYQLDV